MGLIITNEDFKRTNGSIKQDEIEAMFNAYGIELKSDLPKSGECLIKDLPKDVDLKYLIEHTDLMLRIKEILTIEFFTMEEDQRWYNYDLIREFIELDDSDDYKNLVNDVMIEQLLLFQYYIVHGGVYEKLFDIIPNNFKIKIK